MSPWAGSLPPVSQAGVRRAPSAGAPGGGAGGDPVRNVGALGPGGAPPPPVASVEDRRHPYLPLSSSEVDYPLLHEIHAASMLATPDDVRVWREAGRGLGGRVSANVAEEGGPRALVALPAPREASGRVLGETTQQRGSTRQ